MRIVKISGGLGNQMFQYAFSLALKHAGNSDVQLDLSTYRAKSDYNGIDLVHNGFELSNLFDITFSEASPKDVAQLSYQPSNLLNRVLRKYFTKKTHFIDKKSSYQPELLLLKSHDIYFEGNWQTEKYFITIEDEIRNIFTFKKPLSLESEKTAASLGTNSASIHIRRGDYLKTQTLNVCGKEYYLNAVKMLLEKTNITDLMVFSDDMDWCRNELKLEGFGAKVIYVDWNKGADSWQDMALMSKCKNHIIANSTFSWWGAWLDPNIDKIVICPEIWNLRQLNPNIDKYYRCEYGDILPEKWIKCPISK
ncbi:MAG: alpha-1,2-fucosyltransferase [Spirochaetaceae bacterium]|nr:alpha-1,2-fucosyltransferase [Spirochaetaceae bacterium]